MTLEQFAKAECEKQGYRFLYIDIVHVAKLWSAMDVKYESTVRGNNSIRFQIPTEVSTQSICDFLMTVRVK